MHSRLATHAEAVYLARALNLHIEAVWQVIRDVRFASYADLEFAVHNALMEQQSGSDRKRSV